MKYIVSRFNHDLSWLPRYTNDFVIYDRSEIPVYGSIIVPNIGTDIYDKFTYIIDNYDNLPDVAIYTKANLHKYITQPEFDLICNSKTFTPILTRYHVTYMPICRYNKEGLYEEVNNRWYLNELPSRHNIDELMTLLGIKDKEYLTFAPGSNYILPKENILKHPKDFYIKLRSYLEWDKYPGEAQVIERGLYNIWRTA